MKPLVTIERIDGNRSTFSLNKYRIISGGILLYPGAGKKIYIPNSQIKQIEIVEDRNEQKSNNRSDS